MTEPAVTPRQMANALRALAMDAVEKANSGHPGMPMGMADVATVLFTRHLKFDASDPHWPDRDRFVLSAGHGSMLLYGLLHLTGYADMTLDQIKSFRQLGAKTAGHPEYGHATGIETTTGPLGQGIGNAVGMAIAERLLNARYGDAVVDHHTYAICGDGCLMEGISHEAASLAGHLGLSKLVLLWDDNGITIDGHTSIATSDDVLERFAAYGWDVASVDGHDSEAVDAAITRAKTTDRPSFIACKTIIGFGAPTKSGTEKVHGAPLGATELAAARVQLDWPYGPFEIPDEIRAPWHAAGARGLPAHEAWSQRLGTLSPEAFAEFERTQAGKMPAGLDAAIDVYKQKLSAEKPNIATRKSGQDALELITPLIPEMIGGSADLTHSNFTNTKVTLPVTPTDFTGRYMGYGVREHGMVAAMNGIALHGGFVPYGGTFLIFTDYCRPSIRLAALMGIRMIVVGTHDSIGVGEDGPTHQPIEQIGSLRMIPNLWVMRPADAVEAIECWQAAVERTDGPTVMALTRQNLPTMRVEHVQENLSAKGGYVMAEATGARKATIVSTGSEVSLAMEAKKLLDAEGIATAVVSLPCWELFDAQSAEYRAGVLGTAPRVAVEAASAFGWTKYVESDDHVVAMRSFGASGPIKELYTHFGLTVAAVADKVRSVV